MRLLAPLLVAATTALFGSGVAMGVLRGGSLEIARRIHGPASVVWMVLLGIHVLVYLRRAARRAAEDLAPGSRGAAPGARKRLSTLLVAATAALASRRSSFRSTIGGSTWGVTTVGITRALMGDRFRITR